MKKNIFITLAFALSFFLGYACNNFKLNKCKKMNRVTGIGGVFFKAKDPKKITEWYKNHLGLNANPYGATFNWFEGHDSTKQAQTQWTPFPENSKYFGAENQNFMINYRVENLVQLVEELKKEGVTIVDEMEIYDYGKFIHILDGEGNKVQLWEAIN